MAPNSREKPIGKTQLTMILCHNCHSEIYTAERVDLKHFRAGHYVPSTVEHVEISSYLVDAERDIELYDQEIQRVSEILGSLQSQRQVRKNDALTFKAALSPIRRIPMELWKDIFAQCLDGSPEDLHLTEVCSWWKQMLGSFPEIWSTIIVDLSLSTWEMVSASFDAHLLFSKDTALHLDLRFPLQKPDEDEEEFNEWWTSWIDEAPGAHMPAALDKVFSETINVMKQLTVTALDDRQFGADYLHGAWGKTLLPACLESVTINFFAHDYESTSNSTMYQHLWKCNNLRHLDLSDGMFDGHAWDPDLIKFWGNLETVRLRYCSTGLVHDFLERASKLHSMTVADIYDLLEVAPAVSSSLQLFSVQCGIDALKALLPKITLPAAETISVTVRYDGRNVDSFSTEDLSLFFRPCGTTLETLSLHKISLDDDSLLVILRSLPNLKNLVFQPMSSDQALTPPCLTGDVYRQIMADGICPALETLDASVSPNNMESFMDLLDARGPGLLTAAVHLTGYRPSAFMASPPWTMVRIEPNLVSSFNSRVARLKGAGLVIKASHAGSEG